MQQPQGQIEAFLKATGVGARLFVGPVLEIEQADHLVDATTRDPLGHVVNIGLELQELAPGQHLIDRNLLGNIAQVLAHQSRLVEDRDAHHLEGAAVGGRQGAKAAQGGGFTGSIGPQQTKDLPRLNGEGHILHRRYRPVGLIQVFNRYCCAHL